MLGSILADNFDIALVLVTVVVLAMVLVLATTAVLATLMVLDVAVVLLSIVALTTAVVLGRAIVPATVVVLTGGTLLLMWTLCLFSSCMWDLLYPAFYFQLLMYTLCTTTATYPPNNTLVMFYRYNNLARSLVDMSKRRYNG